MQIVSVPGEPSLESRLRQPVERHSPARPLSITASIGLSARVITALANAGVTTFAQLASLADSTLLQIPNLGYAALCEIRDTLQKLGLAREELFSPHAMDDRRTALERELWELTAPAGGMVERGIAMVHFGWDGRLNIEEIRDRYRVRRDLLRAIFLSVETQPPPGLQQTAALRTVTRFLSAHLPQWIEEAEEMLVVAGLVRQRVTIEGLQNACRLAGIDAGFDVIATPRRLVISAARAEDCRMVVRTVQHLVAIRGTSTLEEIRVCSEKVLGHALDRKFVRRSVALLPNAEWIDQRLGVLTLRPTRPPHRASAVPGEDSEFQVA